MKKLLLFFIVCAMLIVCIGCANKGSPLEITVQPENYPFYYVKDGSALFEEKSTDTSYWAIMNEWLSFNGLDNRFKLNRVLTYSENPDLMPELEKNEFAYTWNEELVFCFLSDFDVFINDQSNALYKTALDMTLSECRNIMVSNALSSNRQR